MRMDWCTLSSVQLQPGLELHPTTSLQPRPLLLPLCLPRDPSLSQVDVSDGYRQFVEGGGVLLLTATTANLVGEGAYAITQL